MKENNIYRMVYRITGKLYFTLNGVEEHLKNKEISKADNALCIAMGIVEMVYEVGDELKSGGCSTLGYYLTDVCYETAMQKISSLAIAIVDAKNASK